MPRINYQKIDAPDFQAGGRKRVELPQTGVIHRLLIHLAYGIVTTGGTGAGAPFADASHRVIQEFRTLAGKTPVQAVKVQTLGIMEQLWGKGALVQSNPTDDTAGTESGLHAWIDLPQFMPHSFTPHAFGFPTAALSVRPYLEIVYGSASDLFTSAADGTFAFEGNEDVELFMEELEGDELPRQAEALARRFPPVLWNYYERDIVQSATDEKVRLTGIEPGDEVRAVIVEAFSGGVGGALYAYDSNVVEELRLEIDDEDVYGVVSMEAVQQRNAREYLQTALTSGVAVIDAAENQLTGPGELWPRRSRTITPTLHLKTSKEAGECMVRVTTVTVKRPQQSRG
jgi:hypothetical protein